MSNNLLKLLLLINSYEEDLLIDINQKINDIRNRLRVAFSKGKWVRKHKNTNPEHNKRMLCISMMRQITRNNRTLNNGLSNIKNTKTCFID